MFVREHKQEAIRAIKETQEIDNNYTKNLSPDNNDEDERQNPHKIRFDAHIDFINKADIKKYGGKTLRLSIHE